MRGAVVANALWRGAALALESPHARVHLSALAILASEQPAPATKFAATYRNLFGCLDPKADNIAMPFKYRDLDAAINHNGFAVLSR
jgi:hypothetical protein